jgi:hypothetical protein
MPNQFLGVLPHTMAIFGLSRVSVWACGPPKLMKISSSKMQNRTGLGAARLSSHWRS